MKLALKCGSWISSITNFGMEHICFSNSNTPDYYKIILKKVLMELAKNVFVWIGSQPCSQILD